MEEHYTQPRDPCNINAEELFPFVLKGLGYFLKEKDGQDNEAFEPQENPRDTSHLNDRIFTVAVYPFFCPQFANQTYSIEAAEGADILLGATGLSLEALSISATESKVEPIVVSELQELSDEEVVNNYNRILGGDFPWEKASRLVQIGRQNGDLSKTDVEEEWNQIYDLYVNHQQPVVGHAENIIMLRSVVHDILIWTACLDYWFNFPESDGIIGVFEKPYMTILVAWEDIIFDIKVINCNLFDLSELQVPGNAESTENA